jgi:hypothetical protein
MESILLRGLFGLPGMVRMLARPPAARTVQQAANATGRDSTRRQGCLSRRRLPRVE